MVRLNLYLIIILNHGRVVLWLITSPFFLNSGYESFNNIKLSPLVPYLEVKFSMKTDVWMFDKSFHKVRGMDVLWSCTFVRCFVFFEFFFFQNLNDYSGIIWS
ncbi:hypothetical protein DFJ63DRAFT_315358 [Scheffersomyces coipomensis]|uniref:uncharacterized protein n=1 Tax=Scheffersomyces coipomensis TaxID=1788519 RepID=UPI00315D4CE6